MGKPDRKSIWDPPAHETGSADPFTPGWGADQAAPLPQAAVPIIEQLPLAEKKQRDRHWEKQEDHRPMVFRRVPPGLRDAIKEIADHLQVRVDDVVRAFLEFGLICYQKGEVPIQPVLSEGRLTLFPKPDDRWGKSGLPGWYEKVWEQQPPVNQTHKTRRFASEQEKPWKWQVSYRGIPSDLKAALREIHQKKSVPLGEVATLFLSYSLEAYHSGRLVLNPQPRKSAGVSIATKSA